MASATTTAERIEAMTDRSEFERLSLEVLRYASPNYAAVIALGTNARGETVVSPVDGFANVPGSSPAHYVAVEATTTDYAKLERKWLFDHSVAKGGRKPFTAADDGDLLKAAAHAASLRSVDPNARFIVALVTNQRVDPELQKRVYAAAAGLGVEPDIWERSRIASFLDNDPNGQFLRYKCFGLPAERLSRGLLRDLGERTLARARDRMSGDSDEWISRDHEDVIRAELRDRSFAMNLLVADSGFGKTVTSYRVMRRWLDDGGFALWIPEQAIDNAISLEAAIGRVVSDLVPTIFDTSSRTFAEVLGGERLLLVVDDVNRSPRPAMLARETALSTVAANKASVSVCVMCPVWPQVAQAIELGEKDGVRRLAIAGFTADEARRVLGAVGTGVEKIAEELAFDPLVIALYREARALAPNEGIDPRRVIETLVIRRLRALQGLADVRAGYSEHREALIALAAGCLESRTAAARASQIAAWCGAGLQDAIREVLRASAIVRYADDGREVAYRHDRVRDHLLALGMERIAFRPGPEAPFVDPYYAEIAGEALARLNAPAALIDRAVSDAPLVLAYALRHLDPGSEAELRTVDHLRIWLRRQFLPEAPHSFEIEAPSAISVVIVGSFQGWDPTTGYQLERVDEGGRWAGVFNLPGGKHEYKFIVDGTRWTFDPANPDLVPDGHGGYNSRCTIPTEPMHPAAGTVCYVLSRTSSPAVLAVTADLPAVAGRDPRVALARFRHGDVAAGLGFFASMRGDLAVGDPDRDEATAAVQPLLRAQMLKELALRAASLKYFDRVGAIRLAGRLGGPGALAVVRACWTASNDRARMTVPALQAILAGDNASSDVDLLDEVLSVFSYLIAKRPDGAKLRQQTILAVAQARCRPSAATLQLLVDRSAQESSIRDLAWAVFDGDEHPIAVEALTRWTGAMEDGRRSGEPDRIGLVRLLNPWRSGRQIGEAGASRLRALWEEPAESLGTRSCAFDLWSRSSTAAGASALSILRAVPADSVLHARALRQRARLGDASCAPLVAALFQSDPRWPRVAHHVWTQGVAEVADKQLGMLASELLAVPPIRDSVTQHALAELLRRVPAADARQLLRTHWAHLQRGSWFLHTAIAVGDDDLLALVDNALETWPDPGDPPLKYLLIHVLSEADGERSLIDRGLFERLFRYVPRLSEADIRHVVMACRARGHGALARARVSPQLGEELRRQLFPSRSDLIDALDRHADDPSKGLPSSWFEREIVRRADGIVDTVELLDEWLARRRSPNDFAIAAVSIVVSPQRHGLEMLARHADLDQPEHRRLLAQARFLVQYRSLT